VFGSALLLMKKRVDYADRFADENAADSNDDLFTLFLFDSLWQRARKTAMINPISLGEHNDFPGIVLLSTMHVL
jgi:hypothetical protein